MELGTECQNGFESWVYPVGKLQTRIYYNGASWVTDGGADRNNNGGNGWTLTWNTVDGYVEVTHPEVHDAFDVQLTAYGPTALTNFTVSNQSTTGFRVYFKDAAGAAVTTETTNMSILVNRGRFSLYHPWTGHFNFGLPVVQVNPVSTGNDNGNLWGHLCFY